MPSHLIESIANAFEDVEYPQGPDISVPTYDDEGTAEHFRNTHWRDHTLATLENYTISLRFFTPEFLCFFLPAYMCVSIDNPESGIPDSVLDKISPPKHDPRRPSYYTWWSRLSGAQRRVVIMFLRHFEDSNPEHFWAVIACLEADAVA